MSFDAATVNVASHILWIVFVSNSCHLALVSCQIRQCPCFWNTFCQFCCSYSGSCHVLLLNLLSFYFYLSHTLFFCIFSVGAPHAKPKIWNAIWSKPIEAKINWSEFKSMGITSLVLLLLLYFCWPFCCFSPRSIHRRHSISIYHLIAIPSKYWDNFTTKCSTFPEKAANIW